MHSKCDRSVWLGLIANNFYITGWDSCEQTLILIRTKSLSIVSIVQTTYNWTLCIADCSASHSVSFWVQYVVNTHTRSRTPRATVLTLSYLTAHTHTSNTRPKHTHTQSAHVPLPHFWHRLWPLFALYSLYGRYMDCGLSSSLLCISVLISWPAPPPPSTTHNSLSLLRTAHNPMTFTECRELVRLPPRLDCCRSWWRYTMRTPASHRI